MGIMVRAGFIAVRPAPFKEKEPRFVLLRAMEKVSKEIEKEFAKTTKTWNEHHPEFYHKLTVKYTEIGSAVGTDDEIYGYLNNGTQVRYAHMTDDFEAKTTPKVIGSGPGKGGFAYIGKPLPGIEARQWDEVITENYEDRFNKILDAAMDEAAKKSGHG